MTKRKRRKKSRRSKARPSPSSAYQRSVRQADAILARNGVEIRPDNWQEIALDWCAPEGPEQDTLASYIAEHEHKLGAPWARELLRLEIYFQADDNVQLVEHYDRAFSRYPRCALIEMWVADRVFRHAGDFWRARRMYRYVIEHLPDHPKPYYEMGFMSHLLGDFRDALDWFDQAAKRVTDDHAEVAARVFYNRGIVRYFLDGDKKAAIADMKEALKRKPGYRQAKQALRGLRSRREVRWVPW